MGASSVTGKGHGDANSLTAKDISDAIHQNTILYSGRVTVLLPIPPPSPPDVAFGEVVFPVPLPGNSASYVVLVTADSAESITVTEFDNTGGTFNGFTVRAEEETEAMYIVCKSGITPV